jgi:uncharacterized protein (DUF3084 family)
MTEVAQPWHEITEEQDGGDPSFGGFVTRLEEEAGRLRALAEAAEAAALQLADREASLETREQELGRRHHELDARRADLERWQAELDSRAAQTEQASARIAEAAEREAGLRTLAHDLLERYGDGPEHA